MAIGAGIRGTALALLAPLVAHAAQAPQPEDLADMSLEELGQVQITSVSRRAERLLDAIASVYVISAEEIQRSGATTLAEVLRLAPTLEVARSGAFSWAISARGFNNGAGNKLQVLLDGRLLYTPLFSGVFWDAQDTLLEDIERIEVITGPAATLWGANAVTGVINIITRRANDTRGGLVSAQLGAVERDVGARYGSGSAARAFRGYARSISRDASERADGTRRDDGGHREQLGFRVDAGDAAEGWTLLGDAYQGRFDSTFSRDLRFSGASLVGRWNHELERGGLQLQAYADHTQRDIPNSISESLNVYEVQLQHNLNAFGAHELVWGASYRGAHVDVHNAPAIAFLPAERYLHWSSAFVLDTVALHGDVLKLVAGVRIVDNTYSGVEYMPTLRLAFKPGAQHVVWTALSRAVRTPSRFDRELYTPAQAPFLIAGGPDFAAERATTAALGYRGQPTPHTQLSVTLFHSEYAQLRSLEQVGPDAFVIGNQMRGRGEGLEAWAAYAVTPRWRLGAGLALLDPDLELTRASRDPTGVSAAGNDPHNQWFVRSWWDIDAHWSVDARVRHVGALPDPRVADYTALDARVAWRPHADVEFALTAQNLLDPGHAEFGAAANAAEVERNVQMSVRWSF